MELCPERIWWLNPGPGRTFPVPRLFWVPSECCELNSLSSDFVSFTKSPLPPHGAQHLWVSHASSSAYFLALLLKACANTGTWKLGCGATCRVHIQCTRCVCCVPCVLVRKCGIPRRLGVSNWCGKGAKASLITSW